MWQVMTRNHYSVEEISIKIDLVLLTNAKLDMYRITKKNIYLES